MSQTIHSANYSERDPQLFQHVEVLLPQVFELGPIGESVTAFDQRHLA